MMRSIEDSADAPVFVGEGAVVTVTSPLAGEVGSRLRDPGAGELP
jgi:hypothetical protein